MPRVPLSRRKRSSRFSQAVVAVPAPQHEDDHPQQQEQHGKNYEGHDEQVRPTQFYLAFHAICLFMTKSIGLRPRRTCQSRGWKAVFCAGFDPHMAYQAI